VRGTLEADPDEAGASLAFGEVATFAAGRRISSPIGAHGEFELEGLPGGRHVAVAESSSARCFFEIDVPLLDEPIVDLGALHCSLEGGR
jgi:outer membrane usher protein